MIYSSVIKTDRLDIRNIEEADAEQIVAWRNDPDVNKYLGIPKELTVGEHLEWYRNSYLNNENRLDCIAVLSGSDAVVGVFGVKRESAEATAAEVSYLLDKNYQGKGYASEAVKALIGFAKEEWGCREFIATIHRSNSRSAGFIKGLGFEKIDSENGMDIFRKNFL